MRRIAPGDAIGRGSARSTPTSTLAVANDTHGIRELPVTARHAAAALHLPTLRQDPVHRLLIPQALAEPLKLPSVDPILERYSRDLVVMSRSRRPVTPV